MLVKQVIINGQCNIECRISEFTLLDGMDTVIAPIFVGICGTDRKLFNGTYGQKINYPLVFGHEWLGKIIYTKSSNFSVGDFVVGECSLYCNECKMCSVDRNCCDKLKKFGITCDGAMSSLFGFSSRYLHMVDTIDISWCLVEPIASLLHASSKLIFKSNLNILILGYGLMGKLMGAILAGKGISNLYIYDIDQNAYRNDKFFQCQYKKTLFAEDVFDIIIDTAGNTDSLKLSCSHIEKNGQILLLGNNQGNIPTQLIVNKLLSVLGTIGGCGFFPEAINFLKNNNWLLDLINVNVTSLDSISNIFEALENRKIIIQW